MENHTRKQNSNILRVINQQITPLEIWDCFTADGLLWQSMYSNNFPQLLKHVIQQLHSGAANRLSKIIINPISRNFDAVYIAGGGTHDKTIIRTLQQLPFPLIVSENRIFSGELGGKKLLYNHNLQGLVVDVGQTQIKISTANKRYTFIRDLDLLPIRNSSDTFQPATAFTHLCQYIGESIIQSFHLDHKPNGLVLALPCWISQNAVLGGSSYVGMKRNPNLLTNILRHSGLEGISVMLLNDAELTSHTALYDKRLCSFKKILVITLGFGVGAAIIKNNAIN